MIALDVFTPVKGRQTLYERIVEQVRMMIATAQLRPGDRLPSERELAERLGVSRVPIREAMKGLAAIGLVEVRHGRGIFVAEGAMDIAIDRLAMALVTERDTLEDLLRVRRLLEVAAAGWAAAQDELDEAPRLKATLARIEELAQNGPPDWDALRVSDEQFHLTIARASGNRILVRILEAIQDLYDQQIETTLSLPGRLAKSRREHARILKTILARDPNGARAAMIAHLDGVEQATRQRLGSA